MSVFKANATQFPSIDFNEQEAENLGLHPLCTVFPEMNEEEYDSLVQSMNEQGFLETDPIVVYNLTDGKEVDDYQILDGRNRRDAALDAGVTPIFVEYTGKDPSGFVLSRNMDRRHLSSGQKAAIASKIATMGIGQNQFDKESGEVTREDAAKTMQTSSKAIQRYRFIDKHNPDLAEEVAQGKVTLNEAERIVKQQLSDRPKESGGRPSHAESSPSSSVGVSESSGTPAPVRFDEEKESPKEKTDDTRSAMSIINGIVKKYSDRRLDIDTLTEMVGEAFEAGARYGI